MATIATDPPAQAHPDGVVARAPATTASIDLAFLRQSAPPEPIESTEPMISVVDLFSGCGGMSIGALEGARRAGRAARLSLAVDFEQDPLDVLRQSLGVEEGTACKVDLGAVLGGPAAKISKAEAELFESVDEPAVLLAGPPCQGHSALNNRTRHDDPRNDLYLAVARAAELLRPKFIVIENVRGVGSDRRGAMTRCAARLRQLDYVVSAQRIDLATIGVPQTRVRHVLVAALKGPFSWSLRTTHPRPVGWAIADLLHRHGDGDSDTPSATSAANKKRIRWLFDQDAYDLPNNRRPKCHRSKHSYLSMYGRLRWDRPAQTITSGFGSMGQGRYVHPLEPRTLTAREAARLQFLPDYVRLDVVAKRTPRAQMIGNVAPPALTIAITQAAIQQGLI